MAARRPLTAVPTPSAPSTRKLTAAMGHRVGQGVQDGVRDAHVRHLGHRAGPNAAVVVQQGGAAPGQRLEAVGGYRAGGW